MCGAFLGGKLNEPAAPARIGRNFGAGQKAEPLQGIMQFVGIFRLRPCFGSHPRDGLRIEPAEIAGLLWRHPAACHHGLGPPLAQSLPTAPIALAVRLDRPIDNSFFRGLRGFAKLVSRTKARERSLCTFAFCMPPAALTLLKNLYYFSLFSLLLTSLAKLLRGRARRGIRRTQGCSGARSFGRRCFPRQLSSCRRRRI